MIQSEQSIADGKTPVAPPKPRKLLQKHKLTIGRYSVPYAVSGDEGIALITVNGAQQTMASWFSFLRYFVRFPAVRVVLLDFPGQGRAEFLEGPPEVELEDHIEVLKAVADAVSPKENVYVVGGSWGGIVAAGHAAKYPDRVSKLILGSFSTNPNPALHDILATGQQLFEEDRLDEVATLLIDGFGTHLSQNMKDKMQQQFNVISKDSLRNLYAQTFSFQSCRDISEHVDLGAIQAKTLILNGARDPIVDPEDTRMAAKRIPHGSHRIVPDVGHFLHVEDVGVLDIYKEFLLDD